MPVPTLERELHTAHDLVAHLPQLLSWPLPRSSSGAEPGAAAASATPIAGGITNKIFKLEPAPCASTKPPPAALLVRVFGAKDIFPAEARARETALFAQLSDRRLAPALHAVFANGRVEAFIPDAPPLTLEQMTLPALCAPIARRLARLHAFVPNPRGNPARPGLFARLDEWAAHIAQARLSVPRAPEVRAMHARLRAAAESVGSPTVFAHNDLLAGNILRGGVCGDGGGDGGGGGEGDVVRNGTDAKDEQVTLIDFEYAGWNFRGFDVANFFAECMGGTQDGVVRAELYPDERYRHTFCRAYLEEGAAERPVTDEAVARLMHEVHTFDPVTHLYWGLWGVVQSESSTIDFPYMQFARQRLTHCLERGEQVLQGAGSSSKKRS